MFAYGMRLRGAAPSAQPKKGLCKIEEDPTGEYWNILFYDRVLKEKEEKDYDLDFLYIKL